MEDSTPNSPDLTVVKEALAAVCWVVVGFVIWMWVGLDQMDTPSHVSTLHSLLVVALPAVGSALLLLRHVVGQRTQTSMRLAAGAASITWVLAVATL